MNKPKKHNTMKTLKIFRNTVIMLTLGFYLIAMGMPQTPSSADPSMAAENEFANAGYWIEPVVVTYDANKEDKTLLAGKGYFIDPVVVTNNPKASPDETVSGELALNE